MSLLKQLLVICLAVYFSLITQVSLANSNYQSVEDDWLYHFKQDNILTLTIDLPTINTNEQSNTTDNNSSNAESEKNESQTGQIELSLIKHEAITPMVKGFAILINDYSQPRKINSNLLFLAQKLPEFGYNTILVDSNMALINIVAQSTVEKDEENTEESQPENNSTSSEESNQSNAPDSTEIIGHTGLKPHMYQSENLEFTEDQYNNALSLILSNLEKKHLNVPGYKVYISNGMSAFSLLKLFGANSQLDANAIAISNPYWPAYPKNNEVAQSIAKIDIPILDLITTQDNFWSKSTSKDRYVAAKKAFLPYYRQKELAHGSLNRTQMEYENKELLSWFKYLGW